MGSQNEHYCIGDAGLIPGGHETVVEKLWGRRLAERNSVYTDGDGSRVYNSDR